MTDYLEFPAGLHLLSRWQSGDAEAKQALRTLIDGTIAGLYDAKFAEPAPTDSVHSTASVHMLGLDILYDLYGVESAEYYKTDPERYARVNLMASCLLGVSKQYTTWAIYAFTCEAMGQLMMYPDKFPPGSDPDNPLINKDNWRSVTTPDFSTGVPKIINDMLRVSQRLSGMQPLLQLTAPYSLAADIYGQEPLLADVIHDPDHVNELLDHLADQVLAPWIEHFLSEFPDGWIELSDASGSPFFIGPENCKNMAIRSIQHMVKDKPWADRVFDCNYRGDYVTQAKKKNRGSRRQKSESDVGSAPGGIDLLELTELKYDVCRGFMMRLDADQVPISFYADQSIARGIPLTTGIGSPLIDSNSISDLDIAKQEIQEMSHDFVAAIKDVCDKMGNPDDKMNREPWPSHIYFEDVNARSQFDLIEIIIRTVRDEGRLALKYSNN
ncbi:MAG: hypothetical protein HN644_06240 [Rhodospirillales bacterium]|jgi:hypothetical protein|nr:hypothetical protein [Rhodospirillales bacterium]MBT4627894.1 hypothetical protein [Rhodospirillales bacterium]MBT5353305.1 hypothetical protein [Rhodospirillales bacterium]MBT5521615.1 hypothetical protein [Rhodospirillales bacterium]MBT6109880.1 hypothetical protein [Rhodospirillales bacterium]